MGPAVTHTVAVIHSSCKKFLVSPRPLALVVWRCCHSSSPSDGGVVEEEAVLVVMVLVGEGGEGWEGGWRMRDVL